MYVVRAYFLRALGFFKAYLIYPPLTEKCVGGGHQGLDVYKEILWSCARQSSTLVALGLTTYNFFTKHVAFLGDLLHCNFALNSRFEI